MTTCSAAFSKYPFTWLALGALKPPAYWPNTRHSGATVYSRPSLGDTAEPVSDRAGSLAGG
jgi:hypothetical protein